MDTRSLYPRKNKLLINNHCKECQFRNKCTKSKKGRRITYCEELDTFHREVRENVRSEEGIKLMNQRSSQTEGTFGDIKRNLGYDRLRRRGESGVKLEIYLVAIGQNIRKYHRLKMNREKKAEEIHSAVN